MHLAFIRPWFDPGGMKVEGCVYVSKRKACCRCVPCEHELLRGTGKAQHAEELGKASRAMLCIVCYGVKQYNMANFKMWLQSKK